MGGSEIDFSKKKVFLFDLDDTLINTTEANEIGLRRAYKKLSAECHDDISKKLPKKEFIKDLISIYNTRKDEHGEEFFDFDAEVFEIYCKENLPQKALRLNHMGHSLAARLFWNFRHAKNNSLMPHPHAFNILNKLINSGITILCVTQGKCNYQHTKAMITDIESRTQAVLVTKDKKSELTKHISLRKIPPSDAVMIGDKETDILAGENANINTVLIKKDDSKLSMGCTPSITLSNLGELLELIPELKMDKHGGTQD
ncbi:MAG: HAD hydrolase-like protein [Candidatus Micrarchaeota archaeon]